MLFLLPMILLTLFFAAGFADNAFATDPPVLPDPHWRSPYDGTVPDKEHPIPNPNLDGNATGIFNPDGNSGSAWIRLLRGNGGPAFIADPGAASSIAGALRIALGLYSNALLIVASIILLYHLLVMVTETAHQGIVGGKRANQLWSPIRLVIAIGLLVPLSSGLNSSQYIALEVIEWGSNMATKVWDLFLHHAGSGAGSDPTPDPPDTGALAREAAKIGACKALINNYLEKSGGQKGRIEEKTYGPATLYGNEKYESLCGSIIVFAMGPGAAAGVGELQGIIESMEQYAPYFMQGNSQYSQDPGPYPAMPLSFALGALESVSGGWNNAGGSAGAGWVSAGSWFLTLAAGGSNRVSGTDTLPIVMGPKSEQIRPEKVQIAFYKMAEWIVSKYKSHLSGGGADPDMIGNTVAGRKFVDLMMLFLDQLGVISGLWAPGSIAFYIDLGNSPLAELVDLGHRMIRTALDFVGAAVELGVNEPQHAMYSSQIDSSDGSKAFGPKGGIFFATMAVPILAAWSAALINMGMLLGIFMPLLPFSKFVLSVMTWLLSVIETLTCVPLLALAWLTPYGEGFAGQKVEPGYFLIIHTFLRPVATVFGMIASILMFDVAAYLVTTFYYAIASNVGTFKGAMYVVCKIAFGMMYVSILYMCLNAALKAMDTIGRHAVTWMGGKAHEENLGDAQAAVQTAQIGTAGIGQGLSGMAYASLSAGKEMAAGMQPHGGGKGGKGGGKKAAPKGIGNGSRAPGDSTNPAPGPDNPGGGRRSDAGDGGRLPASAVADADPWKGGGEHAHGLSSSPLTRSIGGARLTLASADGPAGAQFSRNGDTMTGANEFIRTVGESNSGLDGQVRRATERADMALDQSNNALSTARQSGPSGTSGHDGSQGQQGQQGQKGEKALNPNSGASNWAEAQAIWNPGSSDA
ncbi:MAG: DotA/TraY family protein [Proteobacteria bacterium]|nr:DotA/TraY family protein [Pseudomonadota bacterium]